MMVPKDIRRAFHGARIGARLSLGPGRLAELRRLALMAAAVVVAVVLVAVFLWRT